MKAKRTAALAATLLAAMLLVMPAAVPALAGAIEFVDPVVESVIRETLGIPEGPVTEEDMLEVESFDYSTADLWQIDENGKPYVAQKRSDFPKIQALDDLAYCAFLRELWLRGQSITTLEPIRGLALLEQVSLWDCGPIEDLTPLEDMTGIHTVMLSGIPASAMAPVLALPRLATFVADQPGTLDLSPLNNTESLERFSLRSQWDTDYTPLLNHPHMKSVSLRTINPEMFRELMAAWPELEYISLDSVKDITGDDLQSIVSTNITYMQLFGCKNITDISALTRQTKMTHLYAMYNGIADISALAEMPALEVVRISGNPVTDLTPLAALPNLKELEASVSDAYTLEDLQAMLPGVKITLNPRP